MPEVGEVRQGLVWTGSDWVPLKPAAENAADVEPTASDSDVGLTNPGSNQAKCPECNKDDRVARLSGLVDRSTQTTKGSAKTLAAGISSGGIGVGGGVTRFKAETESHLVQRLKPPPLKGGLRWKPALIGVALLVPAFLLLSAEGGQGSVPLLFLAGLILLAGGFFLVAALLEEWIPSVQQREAWQQGLKELRGSFYCERDDVAFLPGSAQGLPAEELVEQVFRPYVEAPPRRFSPW